MSSKSVEELIELLNNSKDETETSLSDVDLFIKDLEIIADLNGKVPFIVLYWFYIKWKEKGNGIKLLSRRIFFIELSKRFSIGRGNFRYYKIKEDGFKISTWEREEMQNDYKLERQHRKWLRKKQGKKGI